MHLIKNCLYFYSLHLFFSVRTKIPKIEKFLILSYLNEISIIFYKKIALCYNFVNICSTIKFNVYTK